MSRRLLKFTYWIFLFVIFQFFNLLSFILIENTCDTHYFFKYTLETIDLRVLIFILPIYIFHIIMKEKFNYIKNNAFIINAILFIIIHIEVYRSIYMIGLCR